MKNNKFCVLVIDDEESIRNLINTRLVKNNFEVTLVSSAVEARGLLSTNDKTSINIDVIISDIKMPNLDGLEFLAWIKSNQLNIPLIFITGYAEKESAIQAIKNGAYDYIEKPFDLDELVNSVTNASNFVKTRIERDELLLRLSADNENLNRKVVAFQTQTGSINFVGSSAESQKVRNFIDSVSAFDSNVIITGPSGSGKEVVAQLIHYKSNRSLKGGFVALNCAAIPEQLLESELFGYEKGAFSGAVNSKLGLFEIAKGGTIFLDEIGDMNFNLQAKILRVIEYGSFRRLGGKDEINTDARIISATNKDLKKLVLQNLFREDLYYRLNVVSIDLPGLKNRTNDVIEIAEYFIGTLSASMKKKVNGFDTSAINFLKKYSWPGNVRELRNAVERAIIMSKNEVITEQDFGISLTHTKSEINIEKNSDIQNIDTVPFKDLKERSVNEFEHSYITTILKMNNGNSTLSAQQAGLDRSNFLRLCRKHNIKSEDFKN